MVGPSRKGNTTNKTVVGGVLVIVIGGLLMSLLTGIVSYRDIVAENKFMLATLHNTQVQILSEIKSVQETISSLSADDQVLKQDQLQDERDIDRLYNKVFPNEYRSKLL